MPVINSSGNGFNLGAASSFAGGIAAVGGAISQGMAIRAQANYQRSIADVNHRLSTWEASDALARGGVAANQQIEKGNEVVGEERAIQGASGVDVNSGTALAVQQRTREMAGIDALTIANNATREAFGYKIQAINATANGQFAQSAGQNQSTNTFIAGGLTGLAASLKGLNEIYGSGNQTPDSKPFTDADGFTYNQASTYAMPSLGSEYQHSQISLLGGD